MFPSAEVDLFDLSGVAVSSLEFSSVEVDGVKALGGDCSREDGSDRTEALEAEKVNQGMHQSRLVIPRLPL